MPNKAKTAVYGRLTSARVICYTRMYCDRLKPGLVCILTPLILILQLDVQCAKIPLQYHTSVTFMSVKKESKIIIFFFKGK